MPQLNKSMIEKLIGILSINPYSMFLRSLRSIPSLEVYTISIRKDCGLDQRTYNAPSTSQVAAIWVEGNNIEGRYSRDVVVHGHSNNSYKVEPYFGCYDPLQYPLLFPLGQTGWHKNIPRRKGKMKHRDDDSTSTVIPRTNDHNFEDVLVREKGNKIKFNRNIFLNLVKLLNKILNFCYNTSLSLFVAVANRKEKDVSCREYYCYLLQVRNDPETSILYTGRLLQQYVVDMYIKIETTRLDYFYANQDKIRAELYQGIVDSVNAGETRGDKIGKRIILPASFIGGPRDMRQRYLNAMALVHRFGKPDIFLTIT